MCRTTRSYVARRLDGIWATAPYLHNGSVPTLHDLLLPANERPASFAIGHRNFDPVRVGYLTRVPDPIFEFETTIDAIPTPAMSTVLTWMKPTAGR